VYLVILLVTYRKGSDAQIPAARNRRLEAARAE